MQFHSLIAYISRATELAAAVRHLLGAAARVIIIIAKAEAA